MMKTISAGPLTGARVDGNFSYVETKMGEADPAIMHDIILQGHHKGAIVYVIRDAFSGTAAAKVVENFDRLLASTGGGNRSGDGYVNTNQIGATQFSRSGEEYVREVIKTSPMSLDLFEDVAQSDMEDMFSTVLLEKTFAKKGIVFRGSRFKNMPAGFITLRRWLDNGQMSLLPHDDTAQLDAARKDDYEIADVRHVVSYNAVLESSDAGGSLKVWNLNPDDACRARLGLVGTGYPYPLQELEGVETLTVQLNQGDAYFLNSSFIHGVSSVQAGRRLSAGRFIGKIADDVVAYWT